MTSLADERGRFTDDLWGILRMRSRLLGKGYPFSVTANTVSLRTAQWRQSLCFTSLLIADLGRFYQKVHLDLGEDSEFSLLFEKIVQAALLAKLGGTTVRFGFPYDADMRGTIAQRVQRLAQHFGGEVAARPRLRGNDKDMGLDVASRWSFGDDGHGTVCLLTQCAAGKGWKRKTGEPSLARWRAILDWQSTLIRAVAVPWRFEKPEYDYPRYAEHFDAIVLDRMRLCGADLEPSLDVSVRANLDGWCSERIGELPSV